MSGPDTYPLVFAVAGSLAAGAEVCCAATPNTAAQTAPAQEH